MANPVNSFANTQIARAAAGLYDLQLGEATMTQALAAATQTSVDAVVNSVFNRDFGALADSAVAAIVVKNVGITADAGFTAGQISDAVAVVTGALGGAGAGAKGAAVVSLLNAFAQMGDHATYGHAAVAFNNQITAATGWASLDGSEDTLIHTPPSTANMNFNLAADTAAGADVMRITGDQDVRIDFTNPANQVVGLDLDGDGTIEFNGAERSITGVAANFEIVDAYSRNPLDHTDIANNFLGDIYFDGKGFDGDGVNTDGNIFLGGLGVDEAFGGIGNDFLAGGGRAQGRTGVDILRGGRNADFFYAEMSGITVDSTDGGKTLFIDGGNTSDDTSAGTHGSQDSDWLLFEANDDDEPVIIQLDEIAGFAANDDTDVQSRSGESMDIDDIENFDASGNLYGFLDDVNVELGGRSVDTRDASSADVGYNYGYGSSAQLDVRGSEIANIIIAGYDNDIVHGFGGNDILAGGNLNFLNDPNLAGIVNDGRDELFGGEGDDNIFFEADGGVIQGEGGNDTLWLTALSLGTRSASDMLSDGRLRFDLTSENGILETSNNEGGAGYGGANNGTTADQTNYKSGSSRVTITTMENVDATGLGAIDYKAAGANSPELNFTNQQNFFGYNGNLQLLGSQGANKLYAGGGDDEIHGRGGNDDMQGGRGNDDFYFALDGHFDVGGASNGDGVDMIRRKVDANGDDLWDTTSTGAVVWGQDFGLDADSSVGNSVLTIKITDSTKPGAELGVVVNAVTAVVTAVKQADGTFDPVVLNAPAIAAATTYQGLVDALNTALDADPDYGADLSAHLLNDGVTIEIRDAKGRELGDAFAEGGSGIAIQQIANSQTQNVFQFGAPLVTTVQDRLIYKAWEDRNDNEAVDDESVTGSTISLGHDAYAEDLVISFQADGTRIAEDQSYLVTFTNLTTQDRVTVNVNGVLYTLQVGIDLDGNSIAGEDGVNDTQTAIQTAFIARLADYITNSFTDDDTVAGKVLATNPTSTTFTLTQQAYNGEETVFMRTPTVTIANLSNGQTPSATVTNQSQHEVLLFNFDGRDNKLNETNVLFWGDLEAQRANLETSKSAGGALAGTDAIIIDGGADDLEAKIANGSKADIANNSATNATVGIAGLNFTVHGDDFLVGGSGIDNITGGTGDDRVIGSVGSPTAPAIGGTDGERADGGKNFYAVQVLGELKSRVYLLNKWEAQHPSEVADLAGLTLSSITPIRDNEIGTALSGGTTVAQTMFDDTLQFQQEDFGSNARFTITLDDFTTAGGVVQTKNDGAGLVAVDADGNGVADSYTRFTNFENIRTVSGSGNAVAGDGQGNDTLNISAMSTATGGVSYNLTNNGQQGEVRYSTDAHAFGQASAAVATAEQLKLGALRPQEPDFETLVIKVDGVESVVGGDGDDLLLIDETESAKNNAFTGGLGDDRIEYQNNFGGANPLGAEPTVTIKVNTSPGVDLVEMTGGRLGLIKATDTLDSVEFITLIGNTAQSTRENDLLDVSAMSGGAVVNYNDLLQSSAANGTGIAASGTVRAQNSNPRAGQIELTVENLFQVENVKGGGGADTVMVADADLMGLNTTSEVPANALDITFATFIDFDEVTAADKRVPFLTQTPAQRVDVINNGQFKFDTAGGTDIVDYSWSDDNISVVVELDESKPNQFVMVDSDGATFFDAAGDMTEAGDRIDVLTSVEGIVAAQGESVLDLTASTKGLEIRYSAFDVANRIAKTTTLDAYDVYTVRISDLTSASPLSRSFIEHRPSSEAGTDDVNLDDKAQAAWTRIEGSDNAETVILNAAHSQSDDTFNLRGGQNAVKYNELTRSINLQIGLADVLGTGTNDGITGRVTFTDGNNNPLPNGGTHNISSYAAGNKVAAGSLRIAASQDAEDSISFDFGALPQKLFILGKVEAGDDLITVNLQGQTDSIILTGFEQLADDPLTNDIYQMEDLLRTFLNLTLVDTGFADHDGIRVPNMAADAFFNGGVGGQTTIDLQALNGLFNFDFDILDINPVTLSTVTTVNGTTAGPDASTDDELVIGAIRNIANVNDFESVVANDATINENGKIYVLDTTAGTLTAGTKTITFNNDMNALSFGGTLFPNASNVNTTGTSVATKDVEVSTVGTEDVKLWGGDGNDVLKGAGGDDVLRGGKGNDTLDGAFVAEVQERVVVTLNGGAATLEAGDVLVIAGVTIGDIGSGANIEVVAGSDADQVGDAFKNFAATAANRALIEVNLGLAAGTLGSVTYNGTSNDLAFNFTSAAGDVAGGTVTVVNVGMVTGTLNGTVFENGAGTSLDFAARQESFDRYVFESSAANNGSDTILHFTPFDGVNGDTLDFTTYLPAGGVTTSVGVDLSAAGVFGGAEVVVIGFNKGTLGVDNFGVGKLELTNGAKAVFITTADEDGAVDGTIEGYKVYFVRDTDATAGISYAVDLVGTISSDTELAPNNGVGGINFLG